MVQWHLDSDKKISGGHNYAKLRCDKKLAWRGGEVANTRIDAKDQVDVFKARGKNLKLKQKKAKFAYIYDNASKKTVKAELITVKTNPANRQFTRENILTKGALIKVKIGTDEKFAIVTSRPGQDGTVQGILTEAPVDTKAEEKAVKKAAREAGNKAKKK